MAGVVVLQSNVPGAEVLVKGENVGTVDAPIEIGIGRVELQIIAPGYEVLSLAVEGLPGRWLKRKVRLVAASGGLELDSLALDMPSDEPAELSLDLELDMPSEGDTARASCSTLSLNPSNPRLQTSRPKQSRRCLVWMARWRPQASGTPIRGCGPVRGR